MNAPYGYCPRCGLPGVERERRPNGNDYCEADHAYPSSTARQVVPEPVRTAEQERAAVVAWLRATPTTRMWRQAPMDDAANLIERGEHRREEEK